MDDSVRPPGGSKDSTPDEGAWVEHLTGGCILRRYFNTVLTHSSRD